MFQIYTLGDFDIRIDDESILESIAGQHQLIKLLKYFLTYNGRKMVPYKIIDDLWPGEEYKDPLAVLRTQISRLRNMIDYDEYDREPFFTISYIDGYYLFELHDNCEIDFIGLENCINRDSSDLKKEDILEICKKGISLYKGEYLSDLAYEDWLMVARNRIDRLYITGLGKYLESLKARSMDIEIISICEEAIIYKPYEEMIHLYLIESLINIGQRKCALNHYQYSTKKTYTDIGETPSNKMKELYKRIIAEEEAAISLNLSTVDEELSKADAPEGALICDSYYFSFIYNFIKRIKTRNQNEDIFLGIVTVYNSGYIERPEEDLENSMILLLDIIKGNLRKGDVITRWNENQVLLLLFSLKDLDLKLISNRIETCFNKEIKKKNAVLNIKYKKI